MPKFKKKKGNQGAMAELGGVKNQQTKAKDVVGKLSNKLEKEKRKLIKKFGPHVDIEVGAFNSRSYICKLCVISATSAHNLQQHFIGQSHQRRMQNDQIDQKKKVYIRNNKNTNSEENQMSNIIGISLDGPHSSKDLSSPKNQGYDSYVSRYREEGPSSAGPVRDVPHSFTPQRERESPPMPPIIGPYVGKEYKILEDRSVERPAPYTKRRVAEQPPSQNWRSDFRQPEIHAGNIQGITVDTDELMKMIENARPRCPTPPPAPSPEPAAPQGVMGTLFSTLENYTVNDKTSAQEALNIIHIFLKPIRDYYMKMGDSKSVALASVAEINIQSLQELGIFR